MDIQTTENWKSLPKQFRIQGTMGNLISAVNRLILPPSFSMCLKRLDKNLVCHFRDPLPSLSLHLSSATSNSNKMLNSVFQVGIFPVFHCIA